MKELTTKELKKIKGGLLVEHVIVRPVKPGNKMIFIQGSQK